MTNNSLLYYRSLFLTLTVPDIKNLKGVYKAEFVGPWWLRKSAPSALALLRFGGWWGKAFNGSHTGSNLFMRHDKIAPDFAFSLQQRLSLADHKPCLVVSYSSSNPFPWNITIDELRQLDDTHLLGMTITNVGLLKKLAFPFLLQLEKKSNGL